MKWEWGFRAKSKGEDWKSRAIACVHPVSHQINLHKDSSDRTTVLKCSQCGQYVRPIC